MMISDPLSIDEEDEKLEQPAYNTDDFREMIEGRFVYADKTKIIYDEILRPANGKFTMIVRPRQFGKSLLCSTIHHLFNGAASESLFKGLWIGGSKWNFEVEESPVIHLDMTNVAGVDSCAAVCSAALIFQLRLIATRTLSVSIDGDVETPAYAFIALLHAVHIKYGKRIVVIIDEYDKPLLDLLESPEEMEGVRKVLQSFYAILKANGSMLRLVFITGIMKFSQMSLFSGLNNLDDISFDYNCGTLVGYTSDEIKQYFPKTIASLANERRVSTDTVMDQLIENYDGYCFGYRSADGQLSPRVFSPFGVNGAFKHGDLDYNYWIMSGSSSMLAEQISRGAEICDICKDFKISDFRNAFDPSSVPFPTLLYYSGYYTLDSYDSLKKTISLRIPNEQLRQFLKTEVIMEAFPLFKPELFGDAPAHILRILRGDSSLFAENLGPIFEKWLSRWILNTTKPNENMYRLPIDMLLLASCPQDLFREILTSAGRIDSLLFLRSRNGDIIKIFIIEYKRNASAKEAMDQIEARQYFNGIWQSHQDTMIIYLGINVSRDNKEEIKVTMEVSEVINGSLQRD